MSTRRGDGVALPKATFRSKKRINLPVDTKHSLSSKDKLQNSMDKTSMESGKLYEARLREGTTN